MVAVGQLLQCYVEMAIHSSVLAWKILWTEVLGGLWSMELQESDTT